MKRWLLAAALAVTVVVASLGALAVASAQDGSGSGFSFSGTFLDKLAQRLGIGRDQLVQAMREAANDTIDEAVQQGRITQEQAQRLRDRVAQNEPGFPWGRHKGRWGAEVAHGLVLQSAAQVLGMSADELKAELRQGKSLAPGGPGEGHRHRRLQVAAALPGGPAAGPARAAGTADPATGRPAGAVHP